MLAVFIRPQQEFNSMPKITILFLPKLRLVEFLQTQCQVDADSPRGQFNGALDLVFPTSMSSQR